MSARDLTPEFWKEMAQRLPDRAVVLDLGAHHLEEAALLIPHLGRVVWHGFEPNPACWQLAVSSVSRLQKRHDCSIQLTCAAIGRVQGTATLHLSSKKNGESWTPSSSTHKPKNALTFYPWMAFNRTMIVPTIALDDYCTMMKIGDVDLVKMDIQGAEIDAIMGGQKTFARTRYIITEVVEGEEYEEQVGLAGLMSALPGNWKILERFISDALLEQI
jgi:FkbM family methyltransferase